MENSKIQWTDNTFNPWIGCQKISPGCKNCYAEAMDRRFGHGSWGPGKKRPPTSKHYWEQPLKWNKQAEKAGKTARVFCGSMCDVFEHQPKNPAHLGDLRSRLYDLITATPWLTWMLLTKRPENILDLIPELWKLPGYWPANVWIGTSVENQEYADKRIPELTKVPAYVRFLSCEPLLGPVNLGQVETTPAISWIICGGESGPHARQIHPDWARSLRDQCLSAKIKFNFKQWGEWLSNDHVGGCMTWKRVGKHAAGRILDGREWNEFPD